MIKWELFFRNRYIKTQNIQGYIQDIKEHFRPVRSKITDRFGNAKSFVIKVKILMELSFLYQTN